MTAKKKICEYFFRKFNISVAIEINQNQLFGQIHTVYRGLLQEHFCNAFFFKISAMR